MLICTADRMWCDQTKNDKMGGASSTYGGQEKCTEFSLGNLKTTRRAKRRWNDNITGDMK
jgi:hypothetical protein